jgi:hypothetical protein
MLLHGIFFYFSFNGVFFYLFKGRMLDIWRLGSGYEGLFIMIKKIFKLNILFSIPPPFKWRLSFKGPKFSLKSSFKANKGVCLFCKGFQPPCPNFGLFRNHCFFEDYSSFEFILTMFKFFDGMLAQSRFRFFFRCF